MARAKALEICFLCNLSPCQCRELARAQKVKAKPASRPESKPVPSLPVEMQDPWPTAPVEPPKPIQMPEPIRSKPVAKATPKMAQFEEIVSEDELETRRALRVLVDEGMLVPEDVVRLQKRLGLPDWKVQAYVWRYS